MPIYFLFGLRKFNSQSMPIWRSRVRAFQYWLADSAYTTPEPLNFLNVLKCDSDSNSIRDAVRRILKGGIKLAQAM